MIAYCTQKNCSQIETFLTIDKWADVQFAIFRLFALCFAPLVHSPWPNTVESVDREEEELVFCTPLVPMNDWKDAGADVAIKLHFQVYVPYELALSIVTWFER